MTLSKIGAAVTLDNIDAVFNWLCEQDRPVEIQDFTLPNILSGDLSGLVSRYQEKLQAHKGPRGLHGPFFGLDLGNLETAFQKLITARLLSALGICEHMNAQYMVIHSPFNDWIKLNQWQYPFVQSGVISSIGDILKVPLQRAADIGCTFVLENCDDTDPDMRMRAVREIDHPNLQLSVDTGHAHLSHCNYKAPSVVDFIAAAENRLAHVHLQDVDGYADRHWLPGEGAISWQPVMDALQKSESAPKLIIEVRKNIGRVPKTAAFLERLIETM